jgi:hypothetical protein
MSASIDDVVVLPCEPATAIVRRVAASAANAAERWQHRDTEPARRGQLDVPLGNRGRSTRPRRRRAGRCRRVADETRTPAASSRASTTESLMSEPLTVVAHAREQQRDRAHADAADAHDVESARPRRSRGRRGSSPARACSSTRSATRAPRHRAGRARGRQRSSDRGDRARRAAPTRPCRGGRVAVLVEDDDRRAGLFERARVANLVIAG